jgi:hypothetical protein
MRVRKRNDLLDLFATMLEQLLYLYGVIDETFIILLYIVYKVDRMGSPHG